MATRSEKVRKSIKGIRKFYTAGTKSPNRRSHKDVYGEHLIDAKASRLGMHPEMLRKARLFTEVYSREEMEALCALCEAKQSDMAQTAPVFGRTHVIRLLTVKNKKRRSALQAKAVAQGWSTAELEAAIKAEFGTRREGGHPPVIFSDLEGVYCQLDGMCEQWRRWYRAFEKPPDDGKGRQEHVWVRALPPPLRKHLEQASTCVLVLQKAVVRQLHKLQPGRLERDLGSEA